MAVGIVHRSFAAECAVLVQVFVSAKMINGFSGCLKGEMMAQHQQTKSITKILAQISFILWLSSFGMVQFYSDYQPIMVFDTLIFLFFAWLYSPAYWAIYANVFYLWVFLYSEEEKRAYRASIIMIVLGFLVLGLSETLRNQAFFQFSLLSTMLSVQELKLDAWGYGIFIWLFSLVLLFGSVWDKRPFRSYLKTLMPYFVPFLLMMATTWLYKQYQWTQANLYERHRHLPSQAAFGVFQPSGERYEHLPFPETLPNLDVPLEVEGDIILKNYFHRSLSYPHLEAGSNIFALPNVFLYQGYQISKVSWAYILIEKSNIQPNYRYRIEDKGNQRLRLSLYDVKQGREIWFSEAHSEYDTRVFNSMHTLFQQKLPQVPAREPMPKQAYFDTDCPIEPTPAPLFQNRQNLGYIRLDNKLTGFSYGDSDIYRTLCQENMIVLLEPDYADEKLIRFNASIIQRNNIHTWANFGFYENLPPEVLQLNEKYHRNFIQYIQSVQLNERGLILKHELGETVLPLRYTYTF